MPRRPVVEPLCQKIGWRIEDLRLAKSLTVPDLAQRSDSGKGHISNVERGFVSLTVITLNRLANALGERLFTLFLFPEEDPFDRLIEDLRKLTPEQRKLVATFVKSLPKLRVRSRTTAHSTRT